MLPTPRDAVPGRMPCTSEAKGRPAGLTHPSPGWPRAPLLWTSHVGSKGSGDIPAAGVRPEAATWERQAEARGPPPNPTPPGGSSHLSLVLAPAILSLGRPSGRRLGSSSRSRSRGPSSPPHLRNILHLVFLNVLRSRRDPTAVQIPPKFFLSFFVSFGHAARPAGSQSAGQGRSMCPYSRCTRLHPLKSPGPVP